MKILPTPGNRCGSSAQVNWIKLAQHRKAGELSRKALTDPFLTWPGRKLWGQEHEPGSREKQAALSFIWSGSNRRWVLLYKMPNLASAHTDTWKIGIRLGAGAGRRGVASPCRAGDSHPLQLCSASLWRHKPSIRMTELPLGIFSLFPLPYSLFFFFHLGRHIHCAAGDLPLPPSLIFISGVFPELLYPALVLLEEESKAHWKWVSAQAVSPGELPSAFASLCSACFPKENWFFKHFRGTSRSNSH